jgi:Family of unknown function (DUF6516)
MKIEDYFSSLERGIKSVKHAVIQEPFTCLASDDYNGLIRCRVRFWDDSYLDLFEVVNTERGFPAKIHYAYTYIRDGQRLFRYDNAPHHHRVKTHPHHKHSGPKDTVSATAEPSLAQVLSEIEALMK